MPPPFLLPALLLLPPLLTPLLARRQENDADWNTAFQRNGFDHTPLVRSGVLKCYKAFFSTGCHGGDSVEAECDTCFGQACFKIGGLHEGVEAYNYGCVERFSSSLARRCVGTASAETRGVACYCWDRDFCNPAVRPAPLLALFLTLLAL